MKRTILKAVLQVALSIVFAMSSLHAAEENVKALVDKVHILLQEGKAKGKDVSKAEDLHQRSRAAAQAGNFELSVQLLKQTIAVLEEKDTTNAPLRRSVTGSGGNERKEVTTHPVDHTAPFALGIKIPGADSEKIEKYADYFETARDLGTPFLKIFVTMDFVHPGENQWHWKREISAGRQIDYDYVAALAQKFSISIIPMFTASIDREKQRQEQAYADFVFAFVQRYKDSMNIRYVEFQNEPNTENDGGGTDKPTFWKSSASDLARVNNAAYRKIKSTFPDIAVGSAGFINESAKHIERYTIKFLKAYFVAKPEFDVFMLHDYPKNTSYLQGADPKDIGSEYYLFAAYRTLLSGYGYEHKPIFISEGFLDTPSLKHGRRDWNWLDEDEASTLWVESFVHTLSNAKRYAVAGKIITGIRTPGAMGLINDRTGSKRKQYFVVKRLIGLLRQYPLYSRHIAGVVNTDSCWIEEFSNPPGKRLWIALAPILYDTTDDFIMPAVTGMSQKTPQTVILKTGAASTVKIYTATESKIKKTMNGEVELVIAKEPVFIEEQ